MWRYLAGAAAALLLMAAGFFLLKSMASTDGLIGPAPAASGVPIALSGPPPADEKTKEEKRFNRVDKDKNGAISREEYLLTRRRAYAKLDANGDGTISFDEYANKTVLKFAKADGDRSGILNRVEFETTKVIRKTKPKPDCPPEQARQSEAAEDGEA